MKNIFKFFAVIAMFVLTACSNSGFVDLNNLPLQGKVFGESFKATGGKAFLNGNNLSVNITNVAADCNSNVLDYLLYISIDVENQAGVPSKVNVVFNKKGETPLNKLNSTVLVESLTTTQATVRIKAVADADNTVEGVFTVPFCQ
ncbi:hypothetical protein [Tenacibaculum aiptasiae]|uniref:hypothetical protein n=1 Tax=Tenacibaculum aiptasiae TaxID=426481 RepID=UPI0023307237|nr:hypothetical protein [Tenacibaculum aiptasiae]